MSVKTATELSPGDRLWQATPDEDVEVEVLRTAEDGTDLFGRRVWRVWAKRLDTDTEGWLIFGHVRLNVHEARA